MSMYGPLRTAQFFSFLPLVLCMLRSTYCLLLVFGSECCHRSHLRDQLGFSIRTLKQCTKSGFKAHGALAYTIFAIKFSHGTLLAFIGLCTVKRKNIEPDREKPR